MEQWNAHNLRGAPNEQKQNMCWRTKVFGPMWHSIHSHGAYCNAILTTQQHQVIAIIDCVCDMRGQWTKMEYQSIVPCIRRYQSIFSWPPIAGRTVKSTTHRFVHSSCRRVVFTSSNQTKWKKNDEIITWAMTLKINFICKKSIGTKESYVRWVY